MLYQYLLSSAVFICAFHLHRGLEQGPNVCTKQKKYFTNVTVSYNKLYQIRSTIWCLALPPRCSVYRNAYNVGYRTEADVSYRTVNACCNGFFLPANETECEPCPPGKYGFQCEQNCDCPDEIICDPVTGACKCKAGWQGPSCGERCNGSFYGYLCQQACRCENGATCNPVSGACECAPGYKGPLCAEPCSASEHGKPCARECDCQNEGTCHDASSNCTCPLGWTGAVCANLCPIGYYGKDCMENCECYNGASCHHLTGNCTCADGYCGDHCQDECAPDSRALNCSSYCTCDNGSDCDLVNGTCICPDDISSEHSKARIEMFGVLNVTADAEPHDSCVCRNFVCECCVELKLSEINLDTTGCIKAAYLPKDMGVSLSLIVDRIILIETSVSVRNPPPLCLPIPYLEEQVHICLKFSDIRVSGFHFGACAKVELLIWHLCVVAPYKLGCFNTIQHSAADSNDMQPVKKNETDGRTDLRLHELSKNPKFPFAFCTSSTSRCMPNFCQVVVLNIVVFTFLYFIKTYQVLNTSHYLM